MVCCQLLLALIVFYLTGGLAEGILHVNPETHRIIDAEGRERYFHGVNVVVKQFPWIPEGNVYPFNETDMRRLQELGLNSLRLVQRHSRMPMPTVSVDVHTASYNVHQQASAASYSYRFLYVATIR